MAGNLPSSLDDASSELTTLTLQVAPRQTRSPTDSDPANNNSSVRVDSITSETYDPMFGSERLFGGLILQHSVFSQNQSMFTFSANNAASPTVVSSHHSVFEDGFPVLSTGDIKGIFRTSPPMFFQPSYASAQVDFSSNECGWFSGSSFNNGANPISSCCPLEANSPECPRKMLGTPTRPASHFNDDVEIFARKVFVGGLPIDMTEEEIWQTFSVFGNVHVDWPRRSDASRARDEELGRTPRSISGYVFLVFEKEEAVRCLVEECHKDNDRCYLFVSSPTMRDKPVQIKPWRLADVDFILNPNAIMDPRTTVFIGGVPRPTRACELAERLGRLYGPVCYTGIDIDPELKYPKGAARVTFITTQAFIAAINGRFVHLRQGDTQKRVEIKPYVMDDQICDHCEGKNCASRYAPYFCGEVDCLQYYCEYCWDSIHYRAGSRRTEHRPLVRIGDRIKVLARPPHLVNRPPRGFVGTNNYISTSIV